MQLKSVIVLTAALVLVLAAGGCAKEMFITVAISENGTVKVTETIAVDRKLAEQQIAMMDRQESGGEEEDQRGRRRTPRRARTPPWPPRSATSWNQTRP